MSTNVAPAFDFARPSSGVAVDRAARTPVAAVTGGRQGIGLGIATALVAAGFDLVLLDVARDDETEAALVKLQAAGTRVRFIAFDLAQIDRRDVVADAIFSAFGNLDCLVNNAGVQVRIRGDLLDVTPESFDRVMSVNLRGTFFLTQAIARRMLDAPAPDAGQPHRSIITVSSINAIQPAPDRAEYCFSKTALSMMTQLFALRLAEAGICTYEIRPGIIRTGMTAPAARKYDALIAGGLTPIARWGEPEDVGTTVATLAPYADRLLGRMPFSTGQPFHVDAGMHIRQL